MTEKTVKTITLRRDGKGPLRFDGERIGDAKRRFSHESINSGNLYEVSYEVSARLFKTTCDTYIVGIEVYNRTDEQYVLRRGWTAETSYSEKIGSRKALQNLLDQIRGGTALKPYVDDDLLAELFEKTEIGEDFVEVVI